MNKNHSFRLGAAVLAALIVFSNLSHAQSPLLTVETVVVGDAGNEADGGGFGYGAVGYEFAIGKYEVTIGQYTTFLNSVAAVSSVDYIIDLWTPNLTNQPHIAGISRTGAGTLADPFSYAPIGPSGITPTGASSADNRPIAWVSWFDAARFANWLHNGATNGAGTETGAYTLNGATNGTGVVRNPEATWWIPSEDEWYKAAYYKGGGTNAGYWLYPTQNDTQPGNSLGSTANAANFNDGDGAFAVTQSGSFNPSQNYLTDAGAYASSASAYGTYDQGGNLYEWTEGVGTSVLPDDSRVTRGGSWAYPVAELQSGARGLIDTPEFGWQNGGFRVATVPEPSTYALLLLGGLAALAVRRARAKNRASGASLPCAVGVALALSSLLAGAHAQPLVNIETVIVGDESNAADTTGYGAVTNVFAIGKYEVTIGQYTTFLNNAAAVTSDSYLVNLWNSNMTSDLNIAGISRNGAGTLADPYSYSVIGSGNRPITYVSWFDVARFANWMNNGATNGASTETGAYTLNGATTGIITKNAEATWWIPSENEWYKAAYYKGGGTNAGYWLYPTQNNAPPGNTIGGAADQANYKAGGVYAVTQSSSLSGSQNYLTDAGAFSNSASAYDTFDQGGNVWEWNDTVISGSSRGLRGGSWFDIDGLLQSSFRHSSGSLFESDLVGFRVASVPEPSTYALVLMTGAGWLLWRRRKITP